MLQSLLTGVKRTLGHLIGVALLLVGLALVAAVVLVPSYLANRQLTWQRDLLGLQAQRMQQQDEAYRQTYAALKAEEPVLLERLAYGYLHLKPAGAAVVGDRPSDGRAGPPQLMTVEGWVHRPMPQVGVDLPGPAELSPLAARAVRLVTGQTRLPVLALGLVLMVLGLITPAAKRPE